MKMQWRTFGRNRGRRWWWAAMAIAAYAFSALCVRIPTELRTKAIFPDTAPHAVAHLLADWSTHPDTGLWSVENERTNYTQWHYTVVYECGTRCRGRAEVDARDLTDSLKHGHAAAHRIQVARIECMHIPLLPWPKFCDESESVSMVKTQGGGALLEIETRAWCGLTRTFFGACAKTLDARTQQHIVKVRGAIS